MCWFFQHIYKLLIYCVKTNNNTKIYYNLDQARRMVSSVEKLEVKVEVRELYLSGTVNFKYEGCLNDLYSCSLVGFVHYDAMHKEGSEITPEDIFYTNCEIIGSDSSFYYLGSTKVEFRDICDKCFHCIMDELAQKIVPNFVITNK